MDAVFNANSYETIAGYVELSIRFVCMAWFLFELKETFDNLDAAAASSANVDKSWNQLETPNACGPIESDYDDCEDIADYELSVNGKKYSNLATDDEARPPGDVSGSKQERLKTYRIFYLHYGACSLVWFIYLPVLIFITSFITELYRFRLVLSKFVKLFVIKLISN